MSQTEIIIAVIIILSILFDIFVNYLVIVKGKKENQVPIEIPTKNIDSVRLILQDDYYQKVIALIDSFINTAGENYLVFALSSNSNHYLTEKETEQMMNYIFGMVKKNITQEVKDAISTVYNIESEDNIDELLNIRIKLYIIGFITQYNAMPTEDIPNIPASK